MFKKIGMCMLLASVFTFNLGCSGEKLEKPDAKKTGKKVEEAKGDDGKQGLTAE